MARTSHRRSKLLDSIADLAGADGVAKPHIAEALSFAGSTIWREPAVTALLARRMGGDP